MVSSLILFTLQVIGACTVICWAAWFFAGWLDRRELEMVGREYDRKMAEYHACHRERSGSDGR
jgi:hypothetical protein